MGNLCRMPKTEPRPYHHGWLRQAVIEAAVEEVESVGAAHLSMREVARRAGVSHAAPAHHFGDKAGIFTAIATEGFRRMTAAIAPVADGPSGFLLGGQAWVRFALEHRGFYEVMFQPELCRADDPELVDAREEGFRLLFDSARAGLGSDDEEAVTAMAITGVAVAHGFAEMWLHGNLQRYLGDDLSATPGQLFAGIVALGEVARRQAGSL